MQVKKFEARSMKEALEMVKTQLGPDAIILSARDHSKGFGLVGQGSVEITAAVPEDRLQRKRFAESKLKTEDREKLQRSPARVQKQFIDKAVSSYMSDHRPQGPSTQTRYVDIPDEGDVQPLGAAGAEPSDLRIKSAAQRAWNAMNAHGALAELSLAPQSSQAPQQKQAMQDSAEINGLKSELESLKKVLAQFQQVPQKWAGAFPGADYGLTYEVSASFEKLTNAGIDPEIASEMLRAAEKQLSPVKLKNKALIDGYVARMILESTLISSEGNQHKLQIFVGPSGAGKTSALVKLASYLTIQQKKKVALITLDTSKVGAVEQLRIYAQILNVPFAVLRNPSDWTFLLGQLQTFDHILCDFPGASLKSENEIQRLTSLVPGKQYEAQIHLVLSATSKDSDLREIGKRYQHIGFNDVIFTRLEESVQHGSIYNFMSVFNVPLHSFGVGPRIPEDFEGATRERMLDLIFKLTKVKKSE